MLNSAVVLKMEFDKRDPFEEINIQKKQNIKTTYFGRELFFGSGNLLVQSSKTEILALLSLCLSQNEQFHITVLAASIITLCNIEFAAAEKLKFPGNIT